MSSEQPLLKAEFNPKVCTYWLLSGALGLFFSVIGIPFLLLWFPLGGWITKRYLDTFECYLTAKSLHVKKGWLFRVEKTIPLDKITDLGMTQGPIMRSFGIEQLTIETAGSTAQGALVSLTGVANASDFREAVLAQRDRNSSSSPSESETEPKLDQFQKKQLKLLNEIRKSLLRLEDRLAVRSDADAS
ncbi:PH domain-containing protein [Calycomorphotria hydatis]|uniref:Bacterial membrane flanked domain protein n=1 Tax=Calycomorphotria hydatis TaxID=2528027 RepID=A0A517TES4_9PLAN|nr:PH domain-containing protein [Calycomorphotria hydatis]QDT66865.1 Bacterial membrane flanked domain protein [Calycomorphotria hydatis]